MSLVETYVAVGGLVVLAGYEPKNYHGKGRDVEAIQVAYDTDCIDKILSWAKNYTKRGADGGVKVTTSSGMQDIANTGSWIVKRGSGDFIVVDAGKFRSDYKAS